MYSKTFTETAVFLLAAGILFSAGSASATADQTFQLGQVTVTADRVEQTVADTPNDVTVITAAQLENMGARTLADALRTVTGVNVQSFGGTGEKAIPYILGTDRVIVLVDGKRMNLPQGIGAGSGGMDLNTMLLADNIERIEVVRGGGSVLYGADAVGGVINIITKKGTGSTQTTTTAAGGNYGAGHYAVTVSGQQNATHWYITGAQDANDGQRPNSDYKGNITTFRLDQDLRKGESLTLTYDYYDSHAGIPGSLYYPTPSDYQDILRHTWSVAYTQEHTGGNRIFRYYNNRQVNSGENFGSFRHKNTVRAAEYQDSARLDTASLLTWGGEWRKDEVLSTIEGNVTHSGTTTAFYIQEHYAVNPHAKWTLGIRHDDNSIYGAHWLPRVAFLYQANTSTSYFANWSKIFKAPKFDDLYSDDGWGNTGNPDLKPETGWTAEIGVKTRVSTSSEATFSLFARDITNAIKWTQEPDYTYHPRNIDHYKASGLNAGLTTKLSAVATADIGYTYLDSHDQNDHPLGEPRHSFHVGLLMQNGRLTQNIDGVYLDKTGTDANQVAGHFTVNTATTYNIRNNSALFLTVNNLFNKKYQYVNGYPAQERTVLFGIKHTF